MTSTRRDEHLRASLIVHAKRLGSMSDAGWVSGNKLAIVARDPEGQPIDDEAHTERLIDDLLALGALVEKPADPLPSVVVREFRHRQFKLTDFGWQIWAGRAGAVQGIAGKDD